MVCTVFSLLLLAVKAAILLSECLIGFEIAYLELCGVGYLIGLRRRVYFPGLSSQIGIGGVAWRVRLSGRLR
ncbi:hypothetical protein UW163_01170 [Ralstonia solanacearum]|nr:hypothetical protein UW163_01170 [Ralstonia solanacearum]AMP74915.1 hypothetical protein RALBFv3_12390 [Ralstonia solanacearum]AYB61467.1 hypothetical protein C2124_13370 [Ralstonia solanacearum]EUJ13966.1 hypothetical protein RSP673_13130 [Ralstonia solanacearum P673]OAI70871.1 hypothetical protein RSP797_13665 [Ralstonia solanacearum]